MPPAPTLLHNSRTFASQKEPTDDLEQSLESIKKLGGKEGFNNANEGSDTIDVPRESLSDIRSANSSSLDMKDLKMSIYEMAAGAERPERFPRAVLEKKVGTGVQYPEVKRERDPKPPQVRIPRSVQAIYLRPLRREAQYGVPCCDLQLRSYSVRGLEFFADFALRAAYYLHLPAYGPVPLPRMIQRWTVPKSHFIYKKSQENFERITLRRLIQIKDGHPESVELWLAFLRKHQHHGVGMKANVWEYEKIGRFFVVCYFW